MGNSKSIHDNCREGNEKDVKKYIAACKDVNARDPRNLNRTPLHWAALNGHTAIVQLLLQEGGDKDSKDIFNSIPLHWAASWGHTAVVQLLLQAGADKDDKDIFNITPLHYAAERGHTDIAQLLLQAGADKHAKNNSNSTPLHLAAEKGNTAIAQLLLQAGADKEAKNNSNSTPLHLAAEKGNTAIAQLLLQAGADKDAKNIDGSTAQHFAIIRGYTDIAQLLVQAGASQKIKNNNGRAALEVVVYFGHTDIRPALRTFMEVTWYTTPMHKACYEDNVDGLRALIKSLSQSEAETQIGQRDHHGWTALHVAVVMNHIEIINVLVSSSVGVINIPDAFGRTPLDYAAYHGRFESLVRLVEQGANTDTEDHRSSPFNSLIYAACNGNINCADFLINYGGRLLKSTLEAKGIFPTPILLDNQKACRALLASSRDYTDHVIAVIAAVKQSDVLAGPSWLKGP